MKRDPSALLEGEVAALSGSKDAVPYLDKLSHDSDVQVAEEGLRALRTLKARI